MLGFALRDAEALDEITAAADTVRHISALLLMIAFTDFPFHP